MYKLSNNNNNNNNNDNNNIKTRLIALETSLSKKEEDFKANEKLRSDIRQEELDAEIKSYGVEIKSIAFENASILKRKMIRNEYINLIETEIKKFSSTMIEKEDSDSSFCAHENSELDGHIGNLHSNKFLI
jgi:hypothetical protein